MINPIMLSYAGSHLYGLSTPESDIDLRGVCFNPVESLLGLTGFEQYQPGKEEALSFSSQWHIQSNDVVIYSLNKFVKLCLDANPNILELLFSKALIVDRLEWQEILDNRYLFLSTKIVHTFAGYAYSQLKRIEGHKRWLENSPTKPNPYDYGMVQKEDGGQDWLSANQKNAYDNRLKEYQDYRTWFDNRNEYRHNLEVKYGYDTKHAMHLFRLLIEAEQLLSEAYLTLPLQPKHIIFLKQVREGQMSYEEVVTEGQNAKNRLLNIKTDLPKTPDRQAIEKLLIELNWFKIQNIRV